ncbi:MAG: hypothetical protein K6347_06955 [Campylobacterales bacterium]
MKSRQRTIRVFEIECDNAAELEGYFEKNRELVADFLIIARGKAADEVERQAWQAGLCALSIEGCGELKFSFRREQEAASLEVSTQTQEVARPMEKVEIKHATIAMQRPVALNVDDSNTSPKRRTQNLYDRPIRSGEEIRCSGDLAVMGRVNSGAKVYVNGNGAFFDVIDGWVECEGEYLLCRELGKGSIMLKGNRIHPDWLRKHDPKKMKKITLVNGQISVKELS